MDNPGTSYLLRFDDFCPTMKWSNWECIEAILNDNDIRPIVAVIPDNRDAGLHFEPANPKYWDSVRRWQAAGWTIGLHGFQHTYVTRHAGLYSHTKASEFAGLPLSEQRDKLQRAVAILRDQGIHSNLWIAPGHSFDETTVRVLSEVGITSISDGFTISPYTDKHGIFWIPQQLSEHHIFDSSNGKPFEPKPPGVWTICSHPNAWTMNDIERFRRGIVRFRGLIRTVEEVQAAYQGRHRDWPDRLHSVKFEIKRQLRLMLIQNEYHSIRSTE
jgi:peptidoglycan/xylan/chitin deacetylase (PgdA/CDA1 family)